MGTIKSILAMTLLCLAQMGFAQGGDDGSSIDQMPWKQQDRKDAKPIEYEYQREADVAWSKYIWRVIDVREKLNLPFANPQEPLIKLIHEAAKNGDLRVFDPAVENADQFKVKLDTNQVRAIGERTDTTIQAEPENPEVENTVIIHNELSWDKITKFRVKEVWFFDTKTSTMKVRIIGIAPVMEDFDANGNYRGDMTMYWVYYPDLRDMLAKHNVNDGKNLSQQYSWDDLFEMRKFESYIYKESNVYDRNIQEYATGMDALLEGERVKQELFEKEHDMWEY